MPEVVEQQAVPEAPVIAAVPMNQRPASEEAAIWAYRLLLGREPESAE